MASAFFSHFGSLFLLSRAASSFRRPFLFACTSLVGFSCCFVVSLQHLADVFRVLIDLDRYRFVYASATETRLLIGRRSLADVARVFVTEFPRSACRR